MEKTSPKKWVIGNWKLNPYFQDAQALFQSITQHIEGQSLDCQVAIAPPTAYLAFFSAQNLPLPIVAQDISIVNGTGAYTGEISADLLKHANVNYTLIGHSERRELFGDHVERLQQKIKNAIGSGLHIIYCVGESLEQREAGHAKDIVIQQLQELKAVLSEDDWQNVIIAYEPIWAIGTGKTALPQDAQDMHATIRSYLQDHTTWANRISLLYGGSVKPENAVELAACTDIDGALVGGASLDASSFISIIQAFAQK
ncbi:triose-phosphate isomerase [Acinetobacter populi]|jgi:triosephosphate isomerase|uniref:Triosephosphate isomerase n=1 Tax=Acinetobacter populi TaxID=1582270 RepID=A0A1Z9YWZ9_9GAMM|nr:triose-phosphate isomerase [Acinetobacter populi]MCH4247696.1 triose-phosphate isomerase [Acinetobacter populi]OUY06731.1 triose-phosphate isomerase [Acinetobacter populi]